MFAVPLNELSWITLNETQQTECVCVPVCASVCVCVCTRSKTRMLGLASNTRNNHSPFTRSHLFTRNKKHTFISCGHAHNSDIHHTDILVQGTGQHAWLPASTHHYRYTHEPTGACSRPQPGGGGGKSRGGAACTWNRTSHSVNLTDANVINTLRLFLASAEYRTETWRCRIFLAGPDELGDHVYDYSRAVQKESCMGGGCDRDQSLARRTEEKHTWGGKNRVKGS